MRMIPFGNLQILFGILHISGVRRGSCTILQLYTVRPRL